MGEMIKKVIGHILSLFHKSRDLSHVQTKSNLKRAALTTLYFGMGIGAVLLVLALILPVIIGLYCLGVAVGATILWLVWPTAASIYPPVAMGLSMIPAAITFKQAFCLTALFGVLFKGTSLSLPHK